MRFRVVALFLIALSGHSYALPAHDSSYLFGNGRFRVPLHVTDNSGFDRVDWPVTSGIPLPVGAVKDTANLTLLDEDGGRIPAQFAALSRYTARDNSIRWLLMDFQVSVDANATRQLYLTNFRSGTSKLSPISVTAPNLVATEENGAIRIDTGPLQVTVSGRNGNIFDRVVIGGKEIIGSAHSGRPYIRSRRTDYFRHYAGSAWNTHGWEREEQVIRRSIREESYFGDGSSAQLNIEERGPLRTTLRIRGTYAPSPGSVDAVESFYNYTLRLHFYAGKAHVKVQFDVENSAIDQPQWVLPFLEAGIFQDTAVKEGSRVTAAFLDSSSGNYGFDTAMTTPGRTLRLQQSNPGTEKRRRSAARRSHAEFWSIDGRGGSKVIGSGNLARFVDVSDDEKGITLGARYFWQEGPRAIEVTDGEIKLVALANEMDERSGNDIVYDLDVGQRYINDLLLSFHGPMTDPRNTLAVVEAFEYPLVAIAPTSWYADTETWYFEIDKNQAAPDKEIPRHQHWITRDPVFDFRRARTDYNSGGHKESLNSSWLSFLLSRSLTDFERLEVASRWHVARNPGWAYRGNAIGPSHGSNRLGNWDRELLAWDRLAGFGPKEFYLWREDNSAELKAGGSSYFNNYKQLPDMEHYANFILFEYYYLTGDRRALDSIHGFVNWALNFQHRHLFRRKLLPLSEFDYFERSPEAMRRGHYSRVYSWMLYSTLAGLHATGSPVMDHFAIWQIRRALSLLRHRHGQFTSWDVKPGKLLGWLDPELQQKLADHYDYSLVRERESLYSSKAQSWMEAQNVLALHEAYKTYQDERILDALWGMSDYFAHHLVFHPELGAFTRKTAMPTPRLNDIVLVAPQLSDRHIQVLPILYHYTGWGELEMRYDRVKTMTAKRRVGDWFTQTRGWEATNKKKFSSQGPERIDDLDVVGVASDEFTVQWTSPYDDGPKRSASRYFIKVSTKPIVEFAPTDNPQRDAEKTRIAREIERAIIARRDSKPGSRAYSVDNIAIVPESQVEELAHPEWHMVNAFWMAEHVEGEPIPKEAGQTERFVVRELNLHNWFGSTDKASLSDLDSRTLYVALCSWDEDNNLSALSNVVEVVLH